MERYKYKAINDSGRPVRGVLSAANESDLYNQLQTAGMELVDCRPLSRENIINKILPGGKVPIRDIIQLFIQLEQLQSSGVPLLDALSDLRDSQDNPRLRDTMGDIYRTVAEGSSFSEAMEQHPKIFNALFVSLVRSGEDTGDMASSYRQLIKYLKWVDDMQSKVRKATRYPMIVSAVVVVTIAVMMGVVVPQIIGFLDTIDQELPFYTVALKAVSDFFVQPFFHILTIPVYGGIFVVVFPFLVIGLIMLFRRLSSKFAYHFDKLMINMPVFGPIIRKISIARYAQTFGALYSSGVSVLGALASARKTATNLAMIDALENVEYAVKDGNSLSQSFAASGEFPTMVVRMLKVGEESGNLTAVLDQIAEFYTKDVDEAVQGLIAMIEPALTGIMGGLILWIAVAVFGPIYSSFDDIGI